MAGMVLKSPELICNAALARLGVARRIGSLYDGTPLSRAFLDIYGQTRDALLRMSDWGFAEAIAAAVDSGQAAPFPWVHQWLFPDDCLKVRDVFAQAAYQADPNNPAPLEWRTGNASLAGTSTQVIWTDEGAVTLVYTRRVTDPSAWEPDFAEALIAGLARRGGASGGEPALLKLLAEDETTATKMADSVQG